MLLLAIEKTTNCESDQNDIDINWTYLCPSVCTVIIASDKHCLTFKMRIKKYLAINSVWVTGTLIRRSTWCIKYLVVSTINMPNAVIAIHGLLVSLLTKTTTK